MGKSKADLHQEAANAGKISADTDPDEYTAADLEEILSDDVAAWKGSLSASSPVVAPDGHVSLSAEDIKARA